MKKIILSTSFAISLLFVIPGCKCSCDDHDDEHITAPTTKESMKRVTLPSKLQYEVLTESANSDAKTPQSGNIVKVHYTGWLADQSGNPLMEKKFDSSVDRGTPFSFVIGRGQVIRGWDEGVMLMKVGEKRRLIIPAELGYGARGAGAIIPPNAILVFDVELLDVQ